MKSFNESLSKALLQYELPYCVFSVLYPSFSVEQNLYNPLTNHLAKPYYNMNSLCRVYRYPNKIPFVYSTTFYDELTDAVVVDAVFVVVTFSVVGFVDAVVVVVTFGVVGLVNAVVVVVTFSAVDFVLQIRAEMHSFGLRTAQMCWRVGSQVSWFGSESFTRQTSNL